MNVDMESRRILARKESTPEQAQLAAIVKAYDMTKDDPQARIPTLLMAVIEMAREQLA